MNKKIQQFLFFLAGLVVSIGFDQWTKYLAVVKLKGKQPFVIWDGVFELYYSENRGAAFGMMQGKQGFFFLIAIAVIAVVVFLLFRMPSDKKYLPLYRMSVPARLRRRRQYDRPGGERLCGGFFIFQINRFSDF